jgi:hypothetical protein
MIKTLEDLRMGKSGKNYRTEYFTYSNFDAEITVNLELELRAYPNKEVFDFLQKHYEKWEIINFNISVKPAYLGMEIRFPDENRRFVPSIILELQVKADIADSIIAELDNILDKSVQSKSP